jgi:tetratricopeptide (TPR) repeat protein
MMANGAQHPGAVGGGSSSDEALQRAMFALNSQRPNDAERIASEVLKKEPRHIGALYILGCALLAQDRAEDAIAPLEGAARGRKDPQMDTQLAIALRQADRQEDALARLKRTTKRHPTFVPALHELGRLLVAIGQYDEAIETLGYAIELAPMMPQLSIQLGYAFLSRRKCAEAKIAFTRALEIAPGSADALFGIAKAHRDDGEDQAAADYFRRYLTTTPDDQSGWLCLANCLLNLGQVEAAYDCFRTAARGDQRRYGSALASLAGAGRGRFWLRPSAAARFLGGK